MIVRKLNDLIGTERDVAWGNGRSRRFLIQSDGTPYSLTDTIIDAGSESHLQYRNHIETCYCIEGEGEVECDGVVHPIVPGTIYALEKNDAHVLRAKTTMRLICVFTPPLKGTESHAIKKGAHSAY